MVSVNQREKKHKYELGEVAQYEYKKVNGQDKKFTGGNFLSNLSTFIGR